MWLSTLRRRSNLKYGFWIDSFEILDVDNHDNEQSSLPSLYADPYQTYTNDEEQTDGCGKKDKPSVKIKIAFYFYSLEIRDFTCFSLLRSKVGLEISFAPPYQPISNNVFLLRLSRALCG